MTLHEKLLNIQMSVDRFTKDQDSKDYKYVGSDTVVNAIREKMNELQLLLVPEITGAKVTDGETKSGTARYFTELFMSMVWIDDENRERMAVPWYGQGVDLAGEKGVGKALTYAEKYFFLKFFHIPTTKDDPDADTRTAKGEKSQRNTAAQQETVHDCRRWMNDIADKIVGGDSSKLEEFFIWLTKDYKGAGDIPDAIVPVFYGKAKSAYLKKLGQPYDKKIAEGNGDDNNQ